MHHKSIINENISLAWAYEISEIFEMHEKLMPSPRRWYLRVHSLLGDHPIHFKNNPWTCINVHAILKIHLNVTSN